MEELFEFEGAGDLARSWREGLRPDPDLTVSQWADRHRMLASRASAEPGRYRTSRTNLDRDHGGAVARLHLPESQWREARQSHKRVIGSCKRASGLASGGRRFAAELLPIVRSIQQ